MSFASINWLGGGRITSALRACPFGAAPPGVESDKSRNAIYHDNRLAARRDLPNPPGVILPVATPAHSHLQPTNYSHRQIIGWGGRIYSALRASPLRGRLPVLKAITPTTRVTTITDW